MATCIEVSGSKYPSEYNENVITPIEVTSSLIARKNENLNREALYWEHEGNRAVHGKWKLASKVLTINNPQRWDKIENLDQVSGSYLIWNLTELS